MNLKELFAETLALPVTSMAYGIHQRLRALYPDRDILRASACSFDLGQFVEGGHCSAELKAGILSEIVTEYQGLGQGLDSSPRNACYTVEWQGHALDVFIASWLEGFNTTSACWIVADSIERAEQFYLSVCEWAAEVRGEVLVYDGGGWSKSAALFQSIQAATFDNLILPETLKREIQDDFAQFFEARAMYEQYRIPWKRGVLLIGPPGNGKTHTVKALINWLGVPCLYVKSFKSEYGTDQDNIRSVFRRARQTTPCILVLEDLDSLIDDTNRSFFLNELDGFAANTGIVVLATTNHPDRLDNAIVNRPSRFDRKYHFDLPAADERAAYLRAWNQGVEPELRLSEEGIAEIVSATEEYSFAYLKELMLSSMMRWIARPAAGGMEAVLREQSVLLREQMQSVTQSEPDGANVETDGVQNEMLRAMRLMRRRR